MGKLVSVPQHTGAISDKRDGSTLSALLTPIDNALVNRCVNTPGLTIGTSSKKAIKIANAVLCIVKGKPVLVAAAEVAFTATTHDIADGYINAYILTANSAGTVTITMGEPALIGSGIGAVVLPPIPNDQAVLGIVSIATAAAIFDATTTDLDAGTVTDLYYDCVGPIGTR